MSQGLEGRLHLEVRRLFLRGFFFGGGGPCSGFEKGGEERRRSGR